MTKHEKNSQIKGRQILLAIIVIVLFSLFLTFQDVWFTVDRFVLIGFLLAFYFRRGKQFFIDWSPFIILLLTYETLRSFAPYISPYVHVYEMIKADNFLFGYIPTIELQHLFFHPPHLSWYDYLATIVYFSHFTVPVLVAFLLWILDRKKYFLYTINLLFLSTLGYFTYFVFPAMPPWLASINGYIPHVYKIINFVLPSQNPSLSLVSIYTFLTPNFVAAMPSLHAAYPLLTFFYLFYYFRYKSLFFLPYVWGMWIALVYLGEHWVIDVIVGILYAIVAFSIIMGLHILSRGRLKNKIHFI